MYVLTFYGRMGITMKDKDFWYHCIDWGLAIALVIIPLLKNNYILVAVIVIIALMVSLFLLAQKNKKLKKDVDVYEALLKYPIPLYGIINYIFNQKSSGLKFRNVDIHLDELSLNVELAGNISVNKNNDLKYSWTFVGKNNSQKDVGKFYLRIGGDSATPFEKININCVDCSVNMPNCKFRDAEYTCPIKGECLKKYSTFFIKNEMHNSKTLYLLDINFIEKIRPYGDLKLKVLYTWPQCYNYTYDFILIDPNNFAKSVDKIRITVTIDDLVIKSFSKIQLFSIDKISNEIENEGQVHLLQNERAFERLFDIRENKIYFVTIENL